ncbi:MAG: hypothetical protein FI681_00445 [SAR202 cluster bacterium]|nr:hypothetical protein [SAR202 cluster bacterium]
MTNFCDKCGDKIKDNVKFCNDCWKFLNDPEYRNEKLVKKKIVQAEDVARHQYYGRQRKFRHHEE